MRVEYKILDSLRFDAITREKQKHEAKDGILHMTRQTNGRS